jgi:hypothetical protein
MGRMRWERLFEDLEAQADLLARQDLAAEVAEHTRAERGQVELAARMAAALGGALRVKVWGMGWLPVRLVDVGAGWVLLEARAELAGRGLELLVPAGAVLGVEGLGSSVDGRPGAASRRFGFSQALRAVSRDRSTVRVHDRGGDHVTGTVDRVLADHLDLTRHADDEAPRARAVRGTVSLPYAAIAAVRRL